METGLGFLTRTMEPHYKRRTKKQKRRDKRLRQLREQQREQEQYVELTPKDMDPPLPVIDENDGQSWSSQYCVVM